MCETFSQINETICLIYTYFYSEFNFIVQLKDLVT